MRLIANNFSHFVIKFGKPFLNIVKPVKDRAIDCTTLCLTNEGGYLVAKVNNIFSRLFHTQIWVRSCVY